MHVCTFSIHIVDINCIICIGTIFIMKFIINIYYEINPTWEKLNSTGIFTNRRDDMYRCHYLAVLKFIHKKRLFDLGETIIQCNIPNYIFLIKL